MQDREVNIGCPFCFGRGRVKKSDLFNSSEDGAVTDEMVLCPVCFGSGDGVVMEIKPDIKNDKKSRET